MQRASVITILPALFTLLPLLACDAPVTHLDPQQAWYGDNRARLDAMLDDLATASDRKVAVFDWDNTVIKNDVGDATTYWLLRHDKLLRPADWSATSPYLTAAATAALTKACDSLAAVAAPLPTSTSAGSACADEILAIYGDSTTLAGDPAFAGWDYRTMEPAYAWAVQLQAGYTLAELRGFADEAIAEALVAADDATQTIGTTADLNAYIRIYAPIQDLITALQANGVEVWILSASAQPVVEAFAARVGVDADHVVGVRALLGADGRTTADLAGCGDVADGADTLITYLEGKRCWMNQAIFAVEGPAARLVQDDPARRPVFAAGDSDTDVSFLQDATMLRLVLNRNKPELMCNAYANAGDSWLVNPMFIAPKPQRADGYACSRDACVDEHGAATACLDERGEVIADQQDRVFCADETPCTH